MTELAEVHTLYESNARSIPDMLCAAAKSIAAENPDEDDMTKAMVAVQLTESGEVEIYGWGSTDNIAAIGTLQMGHG